MIKLHIFEEKDRELIWNINQKYLCEMMNFYDDPVDENENYRYEHFDDYFTGSLRIAYFIYCDTTLIEFAFLCLYLNIGQDPDFTMAEFTIFPAYRRKHHASEVAKMILSNHPGTWEIKYNEKNSVGKKLWNIMAALYEPRMYNLNEEKTVLVFEVIGLVKVK